MLTIKTYKIIPLILFSFILVYAENSNENVYLKLDIDYSISFTKEIDKGSIEKLIKKYENEANKDTINITPFAPPSAVYINVTPSDTFSIYLVNKSERIGGEIKIDDIKKSGIVQITIEELTSYSDCIINYILLLKNNEIINKAKIYE